MLAPVIVDLGPDVAPPAIEIVLDACNEVIQNGVCLPEGAAYAEAPRAVAIARPDESVLSVHIEVRLGASEQAPWLVRELRFGAHDPTAERWRSVGLAIATLVGEGEARQAEQATLDAEPQPDTPEPALAPVEDPAPPAPASPPPRRAASPEPDAVDEVASAWAPVFVGVGLLTGPGFDDDVWRIGGSARAGWGFAHGLQLVASIDYSGRASVADYTASWLALQGGVAYRLRLSERTSAAVAVRGGAQQMRFEVLAGGETTSRVKWNPVVALGIDAWWLLTPSIGIWAAADAQTLGRETRVFVAPERDAVTSREVDLSGVLGVGWWIP